MPVSFQTPRRPRPRHSGQSSAGASWQLSVKARSMAMRFIMIIMIVTRDAAFQAARGFASGVTGKAIAAAPQHLLYFRPEPQGQGAQRAIGAGAGAGCWVGGAAGSVAAIIGVASRLVSVGSNSTGPGRFQPALGACGRCRMASAVFSRTACGVAGSRSKSCRVSSAWAASSWMPSFTSAAYSDCAVRTAALNWGSLRTQLWMVVRWMPAFSAAALTVWCGGRRPFRLRR